jgi:hypothetical protein
MEHPFINSLENKTLEELQTTISSLTTKLSFAYRTGNRALISQLDMAINSYRSAYQKKLDEMMKKQNLQSTVKIEKNK